MLRKKIGKQPSLKFKSDIYMYTYACTILWCLFLRQTNPRIEMSTDPFKGENREIPKNGK